MIKSKSAVLKSLGDWDYDEIIVNDPNQDQVIVKVIQCGICSTDVVRSMEVGFYNYPIVPGHQIIGKISKIDSEISKEDIAAGIVNLVGQTAARVATSDATTYNAKEIVVLGRSPSFNGLKNSLEQAASIMGFSPHFPDNGEYASALGALLIAEKNPSD